MSDVKGDPAASTSATPATEPTPPSPDAPKPDAQPDPRATEPTSPPTTATTTTTASTRAWRGALVVCALLVVSYVVTAVAWRYAAIWDPWSADGDQPQAVWHYWRYHVDGAFPPGHVLTDYAFVMHAPPVWWLLMSSLSTIVTPLVAAKVLNFVGVAWACLAIFFGVRSRSNAFIGLIAVFLLVRSLDFTGIIAGGYARSFGPALTLTFLAAFMARKHRLALFVLVLQAAFYPSVVIPCGFAYGVYTVVAGPMRDRLRRMAGMFVAGLLIIAFGKFQDLSAPEWWGDIVTLDEALQMPSWKKGGRITEAPLKPMKLELERNVVRAFRSGGHVPLAAIAPPVLVMPALTFVLMGACGVWWLVRRRKASRREGGPDAGDARAAPLIDPAPWQIPLTFLGALAAYLLARELAFKLYLPYRPLQHVWPYLFYTGLPLAVWALVVNAMKGKRAAATVVTAALVVLPVIAFYGDGLEAGPKTYGTRARYASTFEFVRTLPVDAQLAGEFAFVDVTPLFSFHQSYVTRNLAHPFRKGFYAETERRIIAMYTALYATSFDAVLQFAEKADVDYFIYRTTSFKALDRQLFNPPRQKLAPIFKKGQKAGFALAKPPPSSIVFQDGPIVIVSVEKLRTALGK